MAEQPKNKLTQINGGISQAMPANIKRVSRSVGYSIWLDTFTDWAGLSLILEARLTVRQRTALAWSILRSLPFKQVHDVATAVLPETTSPPIPPLFNYMDEATFWAEMAEPRALDAYCLASFSRMAPSRQSAFLEFIQRKVAA